MTVEQPSRRLRALPVLVVAAGVFAVLVLLEVVPASVSSSTAMATPEIAVLWVGGFGLDALLHHLPLALGTFLVLWRLTPLSPTLGVGPVVVRGLVAALAGGVLVAVAALLTNEVLTPSAQPPVGQIVFVLTEAFGAAVRATPVTVLAAVLLWVWTRRSPAPAPAHALGDGE